MHEVTEEEIDAIVWPTVLFIQPSEIKSTELPDAETTPTKNHWDNGASLALEIQPSSPHSSLTYTLVALDELLLCPRIEAGDAAFLARMGDLP